jgi:hypothetical protein
MKALPHGALLMYARPDWGMAAGRPRCSSLTGNNRASALRKGSMGLAIAS